MFDGCGGVIACANCTSGFFCDPDTNSCRALTPCPGTVCKRTCTAIANDWNIVVLIDRSYTSSTTAGQCGVVKDACGGIQCATCGAGYECDNNACVASSASTVAPMHQLLVLLVAAVVVVAPALC